MNNLQNIAIIGAIITHYLLVGADAYAQASIVPVALSAPPASLAMYQGEYVYSPAAFWQIANTFALGFLVAALAVNWRTPRRNLLLTTLVGSIIISIISLPTYSLSTPKLSLQPTRKASIQRYMTEVQHGKPSLYQDF